MTVRAGCRRCADEVGRKENEMMNLEKIAEIKRETPEEKERRIFSIYKNRIKNELGENVRFNCIEYLCKFPKIDPYKMAASLSVEGVKIVYDDSSISREENGKKERKVKKMIA